MTRWGHRWACDEHADFFLSSTHCSLPGSRQQGAAIQLPPTRGYYGAVDYKGPLIIIEHNPPAHLVATMPRCTSRTTHPGHEDAGAGMLRYMIAAAGDPGGLNRSAVEPSTRSPWPPSIRTCTPTRPLPDRPQLPIPVRCLSVPLSFDLGRLQCTHEPARRS